MYTIAENKFSYVKINCEAYIRLKLGFHPLKTYLNFIKY